MKNLKYTKTFGALVLAGVLFTSCSNACNVEEEHYHIYVKDDKAFYFQEEEKEGYDKKADVIVNKFLVENNLFPLESVVDDVSSFVNSLDEYVEAAIVKPYVGENGKIDFELSWKLLSKEEIGRHDGICREGNNIKYVVYKLDKYNNLERFEVEDLYDLDGEFYIDFDQITSIVDPVEIRFVNGEKKYVRK